MKNKFTFLALLPLIGLLIMSCQENSNPVDESILAQNAIQKTTLQKGGGFNEFGYNYGARLFNGSADGIDKQLDGKVWGDPYYANDHLVMKWNAEWDRGNAEGWSKPPYDAWENNEWNGQLKGGSGEIWHYKIVWIGGSGPNGQPLDNGGYRIWGQFEVIMSQGTFANEHFWDVHANPAGYGAFK
ncbi:MAG: hypothetical protein FIA82_07855 [Melioribacter sp.]|nr:hypothetical protein [Melioribacter sp.]